MLCFLSHTLWPLREMCGSRFSGPFFGSAPPPASARPGEDLHKRLPWRGPLLKYPPYVDTRTVYTDTHRHDGLLCGVRGYHRSQCIPISPACESFCSLRTMSGRVMHRSTSCALPICSFCSTVCTSASLRMATTYVEDKPEMAGQRGPRG